MKKKKTVPSELIGIAEVQKLTGIRSPVTIWRKYTGTKPTFPAPAGFVLGRRAWHRSDVLEWLKAELSRRSMVLGNLGAAADVHGTGGR